MEKFNYFEKTTLAIGPKGKCKAFAPRGKSKHDIVGNMPCHEQARAYVIVNMKTGKIYKNRFPDTTKPILIVKHNGKITWHKDLYPTSMQQLAEAILIVNVKTGQFYKNRLRAIA